MFYVSFVVWIASFIGIATGLSVLSLVLYTIYNKIGNKKEDVDKK